MNIERKIVIGMIISTEFIQKIRPIWDPRFMEGRASKRLSTWCMEYFDKYGKAPGKDIWTIYYAKAKDLPEGLALIIEEDFIPGLNEESEDESLNLDYLMDQTHEFFKQRNLENFSEDIKGLLLEGDILEAEKLASDYNPVAEDLGHDVDFKSEKALEKVEKAFNQSNQTVIEYPRQLGEFWNRQLRRGAFVALMSTEKRGKTFWLMDMADRCSEQKHKVAFFQAGDMTEDEQIMRICVHNTGKSNLVEYSGKMYQPVRDCIRNQMDTCKKDVRECDFGVFEDWEEKSIRTELSLEQILDAKRANKDYKPCHNCDDYFKKRGYGSVWIKNIYKSDPLTLAEAKEKFRETYTNKRSLKLSSHANGTLSVKNIRAILDIWDKQEGFVPDAIIIDYADLLVPEFQMDFRHTQNEIWKSLRGLSQERHALVVTATQSDAKSYDKDTLTMANFSEDKRKYAHVTAMYGLNQDRKNREKQLGIMRINEIVIREGEFNSSNAIYVLQNLKRGRPFLGSYYI